VHSLPNILTFGRIAAVPAIVLAFYLPGEAKYWLAFILFVGAAITDFFDGWLARKLDATSELGKLMDPIADKLLVAAALLVLVWDGIIGGLSVLAAFIILAREFLVSGLREFLAASQISVPVTQLAKWKTTVQLVALAILLLGPAGAQIWPGLHAFGIAALWLAALLTAVTGWDYLKGGLPHIQAADEGFDEVEQP